MSSSVEMVADDYLQEIIRTDYLLFSQKLARLSALIVVVYDTLLTMDREIEFFWSQRWSIIKFIYFVNRYGGLLVLVIDTWGSVTSYRSELFCKPSTFAIHYSKDGLFDRVDYPGEIQFYFQQWTGWIAVLLVEIILIIRTIMNRIIGRKSTGFLTILFFLQASVMAGILIKWDTMLTLEFAEDVNACITNMRLPIWVSFFWLPLIIVDLFLLVLTLRKTMAFRKPSPGENWTSFRLHRVLVRDQAVYFIGILMCSLANMGFFAFSYTLCAALGFAFGFPCVMGSRILLNLREVAREEMDCGMFTSNAFTSIEFAQPSALQEVGSSRESELVPASASEDRSWADYPMNEIGSANY